MSFFLQGVAEDYYVYFNDGTVRVFPDSCVAKIIHDSRQNLLYIIPLVGDSYKYSMDDIALEADTPIKKLPTIATFKFNNKYNYQVVTDAVGVINNDSITVEISGIGKRLTASFSVSDENAKVYIGDEEVISTISRLRYDSDKVLSTGYPGDSILTRYDDSSYRFKPYRKEYALKVIFLTDQATSVPRIDINTVGGVDISSKDYYIDAQIIVDGNGVFPSMIDSVQVKGRGNTSWSSDPKAKNPYRLKFKEKVKLLGMTNGKNWVLLANKMPGSMLTNAYGMKVASLIGTPYPNNIIPVDLYVNGTYKGSYNITEKVGLYNNSVELDNEKVAALLELDDYFDEDEGQKFESAYFSIPVNVKEPDFGVDTTELSLNQIKYQFNRFARAVSSTQGITNYVDVEYLARYLLTCDLIFNKELFYPKSVYCYNENIPDLNSKFIFGPIWDLDWGFGYTQIWSSYFKLCRDFVKNDLDELCEYFEDYYLYAKPSLLSNSRVAADPTDYAAQTVQAVSWIQQRANYLLNKLKQEVRIPGDVDGDGNITVKDVTTLIDYLLGVTPELYNDLNADINNDGIIDIRDTSALIDILLAE